MRILVLGGGMQGRIIASNLAARKNVDEVVVADPRDLEGLPEGARALKLDALDPDAIMRAAEGMDALVVALPSAIGKAGLKNALRAGKPVVDISFTAETLDDLQDDARRSGATAIVDCGVAPGLSHILAGHAYRELGGLDHLRIRVGGIPQDPPAPFHHAVYFNPHDLISEYYRPARMRRGGKDSAPHPLDAPVERYHDEEMGDHEAFISDGLRSLLTSYPDVPDMVELTLRRPGHLGFMRDLRKAGFFDTHALDLGSEPPVHATARVLGHRYPERDHPDYLLMTVEGRRGAKRLAWRLLDKHDGTTSAMSRTTAYTAAAVAALLAEGRFVNPGLHAPERLADEPELVERVLADLDAHGVPVRPLS